MSIEQLDVIDDLHVEGETGPVVLTILDPLDWTDAPAHESALQKKFGVYLSFVESGEILKSHPEAQFRPIVIHIVFDVVPNDEGLRFLREAQKALGPAGFALSHEVLAGRQR
jgi:hypothetical protein